MQKQSEVSQELKEMFTTVYDCELYETLPDGKIQKLTEAMNEYIAPAKDEATYQRWFSSPKAVPTKDGARVLALMQDALMQVAETMKTERVRQVPKLREKADRLETEAKDIEQQILLTMNRLK